MSKLRKNRWLWLADTDHPYNPKYIVYGAGVRHYFPVHSIVKNFHTYHFFTIRSWGTKGYNLLMEDA